MCGATPVHFDDIYLYARVKKRKKKKKKKSKHKLNGISSFFGEFVYFYIYTYAAKIYVRKEVFYGKSSIQMALHKKAKCGISFFLCRYTLFQQNLV